jgi:putative oxidoreductase
MFIVGWKIRYAAILMIINFLIAVIMVHWRDTFEQMTSALAMLFSSLLFLFYGAGKYSLDYNQQSKNQGSA